MLMWNPIFSFQSYSSVWVFWRSPPLARSPGLVRPGRGLTSAWCWGWAWAPAEAGAWCLWPASRAGSWPLSAAPAWRSRRRTSCRAWSGQRTGETAPFSRGSYWGQPAAVCLSSSRGYCQSGPRPQRAPCYPCPLFKSLSITSRS